MNRFFVLLALAVLPSGAARAVEHWALDSADASNLSEFAMHGKVTVAAGARDRSLVFGGDSLLKVKNSSKLASAREGFTLIGWVNPYRLSSRQQMIVAKNRYSLGERQWGVMLDKDNRFRLYVWQGKWVTASDATRPTPGRWHQLGVVVRPEEAELWVNGNLAGRAALNKDIPVTEAPITIGGVDDNGRIWQNFAGALDDFRLHERPLKAAEIAKLYAPVTETHDVPSTESKQTFTLWKGEEVPKTSALEVLEGVQFSVIKKYEPEIDGYKFLHGVALAWHKGKLYASFAHNKGSENTLTEEARYCVSEDDGETWSEVRTIDVGVEDDLAVSHGVFLSRDDTLWALLGSFHGTRKGVHTRAYTLDEDNGRWRPQGVVAKGGFWPMTEPARMANGDWIMPGFIVGKGNPAAVAISAGGDLNQWKTIVIPRDPAIGNMWGESTIIVDGSHLTNIARYGAAAVALGSVSEDYGATWTPSQESNLPMATSKPCAGVLSNGQRYLICSTSADGGGRRSPLTIAVSRPTEKTFSKVFVIRHASFPDGPGESGPRIGLAYPYAVEHEGKLYVGYSNNGGRRGNHNSAELAVIPTKQLELPAK